MSNAKPMTNEVRERNYRRQNAAGHGKNRLSNRQMRRLRKHDRKNLERIQKVAAASFKDEVSETLDILDDVETMSALAEAEKETPVRPCGGTEYCVTPKGAKAAKTHKKCQDAA